MSPRWHILISALIGVSLLLTALVLNRRIYSTSASYATAMGYGAVVDKVIEERVVTIREKCTQIICDPHLHGVYLHGFCGPDPAHLELIIARKEFIDGDIICDILCMIITDRDGKPNVTISVVCPENGQKNAIEVKTRLKDHYNLDVEFLLYDGNGLLKKLL